MGSWSRKKNLKMEKYKDKDMLTFILLVANYFVVGNFLPDPGKAPVQLEGMKKKTLNNERYFF